MSASHACGSGHIQEAIQGVWPTQDAIRYWLHRAVGIAWWLQGQSPVEDQLDQFRVDLQIHAAGLDAVVDILLRVKVSGNAGVLLGRDFLAAMVLAGLEELRLLGFPSAVVEHPEVPAAVAASGRVGKLRISGGTRQQCFQLSLSANRRAFWNSSIHCSRATSMAVVTGMGSLQFSRRSRGMRPWPWKPPCHQNFGATGQVLRNSVMLPLAQSIDLPFILMASMISSRREATIGIWLLGSSCSIQRMASTTCVLGCIALSSATMLSRLSQSRLNQVMALTTYPMPV